MSAKLSYTFKDIAGLDNLLLAWQEFVRGKRDKRDVQEFYLRLQNNRFNLHSDLIHHTYRHGGYQAFHIFDPKPRNIHKATVRDRLLHHAVYRRLYPFFDRIFGADSYSCRIGKGTHRALNRFRSFAYKASHNHTKTCWALKCDIKKFFENIDHQILKKILQEYIPDKNLLWLLDEIIDSFHARQEGRGLPLGNLTSQLFVNIYMNKFDQFVKHKLRAKFYVRYADDFAIFSRDYYQLEGYIPIIQEFLNNKLKLSLHPDKVSIQTTASGIDFLGWVHFPDHRVLRTKTKKRAIRRIQINPQQETLSSYLGLLSHGNARRIQKEMQRVYLLYQRVPTPRIRVSRFRYI